MQTLLVHVSFKLPNKSLGCIRIRKERARAVESECLYCARLTCLLVSKRIWQKYGTLSRLYVYITILNIYLYIFYFCHIIGSSLNLYSEDISSKCVLITTTWLVSDGRQIHNQPQTTDRKWTSSLESGGWVLCLTTFALQYFKTSVWY